MGSPPNYNSSITRVRPVFSHLLHRDPSGATWLNPLLGLSRARAVVGDVAESPGTLSPDLSLTRTYVDRVLRRYGIESIDLARCFESPVPPPAAFLEWLIRNPADMAWPTRHGQEVRFGNHTQRRREVLFGRHGAEAQRKAEAEALAELADTGSLGSRRRWWAFEGFTEVDCYLETDRLVLFIEGKRTEGLSGSTDWYPSRDQLVRNVEAASELAGRKEYAVLLVVEDPAGVDLSEESIAESLPHLSLSERSKLASRCLGPVTWQEVLEHLEIDPGLLPNTSQEVASELNLR